MSNNIKKIIREKYLRLRAVVEKFGARTNDKGDRIIQSKMFLCVVSFCISVLLWSLVVRDGNAESVRTMRDTIEYLNLAPGLSLNAPTKEIEIKLEGKINELSSVEGSDLVTEVDLANLRPGRYTLPVRFEAPTFARVRSWQPALVEVEIYRNVERSIVITPETTGEAPDGKVLASISLNPDHATVSGPETDVVAVHGLSARINLNRLTESGSITVPLIITESGLRDDSTVYAMRSRITVEPQEVEATVVFEDEIVADRIPLNVSVVGTPREGLQVRSVTIVPDSVSIRGSSDAVKSIKSLELSPVDITGLEQDLQLTIPMEPTQLPPGVEIVGTDRARVEVHLSRKMGTMTFHNVPLMMTGSSSATEWRFSPSSVSLTIEGPENAIDKLDSAQPPCEVYIDVSNIVSQHTELPALVRGLRPGFSVVSIEPEYISVASLE